MEPALQTTSTLRHSYLEQGRRESTARIACLATRTDIFLLTSIPFIPYGKTSSSAMPVPWQTSFFVFFTSWPIVLPPQAAAFVSFRTTPPGADTWAASFILSERGAGRKRWQEWEPLSPLFPRAGSRASCVSSPQNTLLYQSAFPFEQESAGKKGICIFLSFLCLLLLVAPARSEDALDSARHPQGLGGCCRSIPRAPSGCCPITALPDEPYLERPILKAGSPQVHELPNLFFLSPFSWLASC